jgi:hypothetical protein
MGIPRYTEASDLAFASRLKACIKLEKQLIRAKIDGPENRYMRGAGRRVPIGSRHFDGHHVAIDG